MNEPTWKLIKDQISQQENIVWREWPDGRQESCLVTAEEYVKWLEAGNTPEPADEATG
jgi:hypothetical protein